MRKRKGMTVRVKVLEEISFTNQLKYKVMATAKKVTPKKVTPSFTFGDAIEQSLPIVPREAYSQVKPGEKIVGIIESVASYKGYTKCNLKVHDHVITNLTLWDTSLTEAIELIGKKASVFFRGMKENGYPDVSGVRVDKK